VDQRPVHRDEQAAKPRQVTRGGGGGGYPCRDGRVWFAGSRVKTIGDQQERENGHSRAAAGAGS